MALRRLLAGNPDPALRAYRDTVLFNSAAGLIVAGVAQNLTDAVALATRSLATGAAQAALDHLIRATNVPAHANPNSSGKTGYGF